MNREPLTVSNTSSDGERLTLHGNVIARHGAMGLEVTLAGWNSNTTRERLNGLPGVSVCTKLGQAFLNGKAWSGAWARPNAQGFEYVS